MDIPILKRDHPLEFFQNRQEILQEGLVVPLIPTVSVCTLPPSRPLSVDYWQFALPPLLRSQCNGEKPMTGDGFESNGLQTVEKQPTVNAVQQDTIEIYRHFSKIAGDLAKALTLPSGFQRSKVSDELLALALRISGASVATLREVTHGEDVILTDHLWAHGQSPVGQIPEKKHRDDCRPRLDDVVGGVRLPQLLQTARRRRRDGSVANEEIPESERWYKEEELAHFEWLRGEAFIPLISSSGVAKAIIVLGDPRPGCFDDQCLNRLRESSGLFNALYELADLAQDRVEKAQLLMRVSAVLPQIAAADSVLAFARAVCALLTSGSGFGFDRALVFWMPNRDYPAECRMAVGGMDDGWTKIREQFGCQEWSLGEFVEDALRHPDVGCREGEIRDPLYQAACGSSAPLMFGAEESSELAKFLRTGRGSAGGSVLKLSHKDPWVEASHQARGEMFFNRHSEFFVFRLQPSNAAGDAAPLGFIIADLPYKPQPHCPGLGFPDLVMTAFTIQLLAGLWQFRDQSQSYFHILAAMPILHHNAGEVALLVDDCRRELPKELPESAEVAFQKLRTVAEEVSRAKEIVDRVRDGAANQIVADLRKFLDDFTGQAERRHPGKLRCTVDVELEVESAAIHPDALESILTCLCDNAAVHGVRDSFFDTIHCHIHVQSLMVPCGHRRRPRLLLVVENTGAPIPEQLVPFLFADEVSERSSDGHGTGLSSARQIAKAYRGDVQLLSTAPVRFGVVLLPMEERNSSHVPSSGS